MKKTVAIIGAGPAGLTAAIELLRRSANHRIVVLEATGDIGGISKTVNYKGNRLDMGGHRFFSKSGAVMDWWLSFLPLQGAPSSDDLLLGRRVELSGAPEAPDPEKTDTVMLRRNRLSRIYYLRRFFDYPISLGISTIRNLGVLRMLFIGMSYLRARLFPIRVELTLEDFLINRFGRVLYSTFFRDYTEKVWGVPPSRIKPDWGAQRIRGISVTSVLRHALKRLFSRGDRSIHQRGTETSLIDSFLYPKFGPGQMWELVAGRITASGGEILLNCRVVALECQGGTVRRLRYKTGAGEGGLDADYVISSMPIKDLVSGMEASPDDVREVADGLVYRDFVTAGLLLKRLRIRNETAFKTVNGIIPDNWIYVQESDVRVGRLQIFNNWSPYMVADPYTVWIGMEYFCNEGDEIWSLSDGEFLKMAASELQKIGVADAADVMDGTVVRLPKTYPAYFGTYNRFETVRKWLDGFENLFLVGRNGMHRYNNMDHSMLTAMEAAACIIDGTASKDGIWAVNAEEEYHEEKSGAQ